MTKRITMPPRPWEGVLVRGQDVAAKPNPILSQADLERCREIREYGAGRIKNIVDAVAEETGIQARYIVGLSRRAQVSEARQLVYYLANQSGITSADIGRAMNRDHSTVLSGIKAEEKRRNKGLTLDQ
jgi:chromosomal replication initiation ATPase DnaA